MKRTSILAIMILMSALAVGQNSVGDGNSIIKSCHDAVRMFGDKETNLPWEAVADAMYCRGLVHGVLTDLAMHNEIGTVTKGATPDQDRFPNDLQALRVVDKFLHDHPEKLAESDVLLVNLALSQAFPSK
jgi:hypothetical protein